MLTGQFSRRAVIIGSLAATLLLAFAERAAALPPYVRIEEDWELVLNTPDLSFPTPQLVIQMKPAEASNKTALFLVNHHDTPKFNAGGGQIQLWVNDELRTYKSFTGPTLVNVGERVTWTQYMKRDGSRISFGLSAVAGDAWGTNTTETLGGPISWADTYPEFWHYESNVSVRETTISFGPERIQSLRLVKVRKYKLDGTFDEEDGRTLYPAE